jgi:hypothetical protein
VFELGLATGSSGILIYDLATPSTPELVAHLDDIGSVVGIDISGDLLTAVSHQDTLVFDVTDRENPVSLGKQANNQFGLAVQLVDHRVYVADWAYLSIWDVDTSVRSPAADFQSSPLYLYNGGGSATLEITNLGADTLEILDAAVDDDRVSLNVLLGEIPPGESTELTVTLDESDADSAIDSRLCIVTNDPDNPVAEIAIQSTSSDALSLLAVGETAPDFTLESIDGDPYRLSDQLGNPVVLVYFATR